MAIRRFFTDSLVVRKLKTISGYKRKYQATATVEGHIQQMDAERAAYVGGIVGRTYMGWLPIDLDFIPEPDDQITDGQGRIFVVKTVNKLDYGINQHYELILERWNPEDRE